MIQRVFLIVLDSYGIGEAPDAADFGDYGVNTLASIARSASYDCPNLTSLGLFNIDGVTCKSKSSAPIGSFARLQEQSMGKDTIIGHWEIAGIVSPKPMPTFPHGFPNDFMQEFEKATGRKCICNLPYSGTQLLTDYGEEHLKTGALIVYTSADSVFQIAANEAAVPLEELYRCCEIARNMLKGNLAVGRVIARPFIGSSPKDFQRTSQRHDYALSPTSPTMLDVLQRNGKEVISVGKIYDIFNGKGITESNRTVSNANGMEITLQMQKREFNGLCFVNLVDFDMLYGHRRNIDQYAEASTEFDRFLTDFLANMRQDDLLIITADHGCDPAYKRTTDHTREYVPLLLYGQQVKKGVNLGTIQGLSTIANTVCQSLGVDSNFPTAGVWNTVINQL